MKKQYKELELETVDFEAEDVITASGGDCPKDLPICLNFGCLEYVDPCKVMDICECFSAMECIVG